MNGMIVVTTAFLVGSLLLQSSAASGKQATGQNLRASEQEQQDSRILLKEKKEHAENEKQVPSSDDYSYYPGGTTLLLLDMQTCLQSHGELPIDGADDDSKRVAQMIHNHADEIDRIIATMDSLDKLHISHPGFWINDDGYHPDPYTVITYEDVASQRYVPNPRIQLSASDSEKLFDKGYFNYKHLYDDEHHEGISLYSYALAYLQQLNETNQYSHVVWPEHCLVGAEGHAIDPDVMDALLQWSETSGKTVEWIEKGRHQLTQCYSCLRAQVAINEQTDFNYDLYESLLTSEQLLVAGQAKSHGVNLSLRDLLDMWPAEETDRITLLVDATSPVKGFEQEAQELDVFLTQQGVRLVNTQEAFA